MNQYHIYFNTVILLEGKLKASEMESKEDTMSSSQELTGMKPSDESKDQLADVEPLGYALNLKADLPFMDIVFFTTEVKTYLVMKLRTMRTKIIQR